MRKWIAGLLIAVLAVAAWFGRELWMPPMARLSLDQLRAMPLRRVGVFLLKHTDPAMKNISRYLTEEFLESPDELFLYFQKEEQQAELPAPEVLPEAVQAANLSALSGTYNQVNGTAVANSTDFDVRALLDDTVEMPDFEAGKPAVLIYHTHTTECYRNEEGVTNTTDVNKNVVAVGKAMKQVFERRAIPPSILPRCSIRRNLINLIPIPVRRWKRCWSSIRPFKWCWTFIGIPSAAMGWIIFPLPRWRASRRRR